MKREKRAIISIIWLVLGIVLVSLGFAEKIDEYWSSMGSALAIVGAVQLLRGYRLRKNPEYREKMEIAETDERNHFIRNKAWAWTGYIFVLTAALSVIVLRLLGQELLSQAAAYTVCFVMVVYWISYMVLRKKY